MSHHQHGYSWPSLVTPPYHPLFPRKCFYLTKISSSQRVTQQGFLCLIISLVFSSHRSSLLASPLDDIQCRQRADEFKLLLDGQHWHVQELRPKEECHLWVWPDFFNSAQNGLQDGREVAIQLVSCSLLFPAYVWNSMQYPCILPI